MIPAPELRALVEQWRNKATALASTAKCPGNPDSQWAGRLKARADTYTGCADELERLLLAQRPEPSGTCATCRHAKPAWTDSPFKAPLDCTLNVCCDDHDYVRPDFGCNQWSPAPPTPEPAESPRPSSEDDRKR